MTFPALVQIDIALLRGECHAHIWFRLTKLVLDYHIFNSELMVLMKQSQFLPFQKGGLEFFASSSRWFSGGLGLARAREGSLGL